MGRTGPSGTSPPDGAGSTDGTGLRSTGRCSDEGPRVRSIIFPKLPEPVPKAHRQQPFEAAEGDFIAPHRVPASLAVSTGARRPCVRLHLLTGLHRRPAPGGAGPGPIGQPRSGVSPSLRATSVCARARRGSRRSGSRPHLAVVQRTRLLSLSGIVLSLGRVHAQHPYQKKNTNHLPGLARCQTISTDHQAIPIFQGVCMLFRPSVVYRPLPATARGSPAG